MRQLLWVLLIKAALVSMVILYGHVDLGPDEAQYWTWSRHLDWGYYSKPPGIAWQIWLSTLLFGQNALGVRVSALVLSAALSLATYRLGRSCGLSDDSSGWAGIVIALSPIGILGSLMATTDGGLVLFWTLAMAEIALAIRREQSIHWLRLGLVVGVGALFKWPIYYVWIVVGVLAAIFPKLRSPRLLYACLLSLLALIPSVYWNAFHDWATFRHVQSTIQGESVGAVKPPGNPLDFFAAQVGLLTPVAFALWWLALRRWSDLPKALKMTTGLSLAVMTAHLCLSVFQKMQGNWCAYIYPMAAVTAVWMAVEMGRRSQTLLKASLVLAAVGVYAVLWIPSLQVVTGSPPYKANPFRHNVGWNQLGAALDRAGFHPDRDFAFSDKYQTTSLLSFYGVPDARAYFFNLNGARRNQFSYWPSMADEQLGKDGYFVWAENLDRMDNPEKQLEAYLNLLRPYFQEVQCVGRYPLFQNGDQVVKVACIFKCKNYLGSSPETVEVF